MRLNSILSLLIAAVLVTPAFAQQNQGGVQPGLNWPGMIPPQLEPGTYKFTQFNQSELQKFLAQEIFQRNAADREYFVNAIKDIDTAYQKFVEDQIVGQDGMKWLSDQTSNGARIPAINQDIDPETFELRDKNADLSKPNFASAINRFNATAIQLRAKAKALTFISGAFPSQQKVTIDENNQQEIPNYGSINFAPFTEYYEGAINNLIDWVSNMKYVRDYPDGVPEVIQAGSGRGLSMDTSKWRIPTARLQGMLAKIEELQAGTMEAEQAASQFTLFLLQDVIVKYLETYGFSERWRNQNATQKKERLEWAQKISDIFFMREWLRKERRMFLGVVGVTYDKKFLNLDVFLNRTRDLFTFRKNPVYKYGDAVAILQSYRMIVTELTRRSAGLTQAQLAGQAAVSDAVKAGLENDNAELASQDAINDTASIYLSKGTSLITLIAGNAPLALIGLQVMRMLAADAESEVMLWEGKYDQFETRFIDRYFNTDKDFDTYQELTGRVKNLAEGNEIVAEGMPGYYLRACVLQSSLNERNLDLAKELRAQYEILINGGESSESAKRRAARTSRVDDEIERRRQERLKNQQK